MRVEAVEALAALFVIVGPVGIFLRVFGELGRHVVELALGEVAGRHILRIVHAGPRFGDDVGRVGIEEAGPEKEGLLLVDTAFHVGDGAFADPVAVVEFLRQIPGEGVAHVVGAGILVIRIGRPLLEVVVPVGEALLLHPDGVVLAGMGLIGVHTRRLDVVEAVPGAVKIAPEVQVAQNRLALDATRCPALRPAAGSGPCRPGSTRSRSPGRSRRRWAHPPAA